MGKHFSSTPTNNESPRSLSLKLTPSSSSVFCTGSGLLTTTGSSPWQSEAAMKSVWQSSTGGGHSTMARQGSQMLLVMQGSGGQSTPGMQVSGGVTGSSGTQSYISPPIRTGVVSSGQSSGLVTWTAKTDGTKSAIMESNIRIKDNLEIRFIIFLDLELIINNITLNKLT